MLAADAQFRETANAAAEAWRRQPAFIAYRVHVAVDVPALKKYRVIERAVEARTLDDYAVLQDLPQGQRQYGHSFPLLPTFDALSYFRLQFTMGDPVRMHNPLSAVRMERPITFANPAASTAGVSVVATTLRNYYAHYAEDSTDQRPHIVMDALPALTRGNNSTFYIHDVFIDPQTNLPTRVTYVGPSTEFDLDYTTVQNTWVVNHVFYRDAVFAPLHIGRTTYTIDARYDEFAFPASPADQQLVTAPTPAPSASPQLGAGRLLRARARERTHDYLLRGRAPKRPNRDRRHYEQPGCPIRTDSYDARRCGAQRARHDLRPREHPIRAF
ncbi:MAG: hypothetical protein NVSMB64_03890 [Candidatus Velthaea sp.]